MTLSRILLVLVALGLAYLLFWPVPIHPTAWTPPPAPKLEGAYAPNDKLKDIQKLAPKYAVGPEGLSVDKEGSVYAGLLDGRVVKFKPDGSDAQELVNTGGRPLGTAVLPDGRILVADADKGLLEVSKNKMTVLSAQAGGVPFKFTDDLDYARGSPMVYFTDASSKFGIKETLSDAIEHGANGRLLSYNLDTKKTEVVQKDMFFPNGVAMGPDDAYVLVNETTTYRILKVWLKGEKAGKAEVFADNLPGFPDNIKFNGRDRFWCALYAPRTADLDRALPYPFLRKIIFRLPAAVQPKPVMHAFALGFNVEGKVVANLQYEGPDVYAPITSVVESGEWLYFGSLSAPAIGRMPLAKALAQ